MRILPSRRRLKAWLIALAVVVALPLIGYALWSPGQAVTDGRHDRQTNGIWMSHRWLGDDAWFTSNQREQLRDQYRDPDYIASELNQLAQRGVALYSLWEMDEDEWDTLARHFLKPKPEQDRR